MATDRQESRPQVMLTVYHRPDCHLCEEMIAGLRQLQARFPFDVGVIDVDGDPALAVRYGHSVPVLTHGEVELCRHRIEPARLAAYLEIAVSPARTV